jgi:Predicted dehydrogenases and related proteins
MNDTKTKIGIIGFEHMHALSYTTALKNIEDVIVMGIADQDEFRGTQMAAKFSTKYYNDYHELLDTDMEGVIVCTNNKMHCQVSVDAANKGMHVLVEKPFAVNTEAAQKMLKAAEKNNVRIMTAFPMRFNSNVIEAKRQIDNGEIGDILCITGINHGKIPSGWFIDPELAGGGSVINHTVHLSDLMRWFVNSEYKKVYCESGNLIHNKNIDDCGIINVDFENGVFASIDCSWAHHKNYTIWPQVDMEIIGTKGVIELKAFGQTERIYDAVNQTIDDMVWNEEGDEGLVSEFVDVCRTGKHPNASGLDGARAMEVALAAYQSSATHKAVTVEHVSM